jgi:hypothetical protein
MENEADSRRLDHALDLAERNAADAVAWKRQAEAHELAAARVLREHDGCRHIIRTLNDRIEIAIGAIGPALAAVEHDATATTAVTAIYTALITPTPTD